MNNCDISEVCYDHVSEQWAIRFLIADELVGQPEYFIDQFAAMDMAQNYLDNDRCKYVHFRSKNNALIKNALVMRIAKNPNI